MDILDSLLLYCRTITFASSMPNLASLVSTAIHHSTSRSGPISYLSATSLASMPWLLPVSSLMELVAMMMRLCPEGLRMFGESFA